MFHILTFTVFLFQVEWALSTFCETGWTHHNGICYSKNETERDQRENDLMCKLNGGTMVIFKNEEENNFVKNFIGDTGFYWLGGVQVKQGSPEFKWMDGSQMTYTNWCPGESNEFHVEKSVYMDISEGRGWNDVECNANRKLLCQKPVEEQKPMVKDNEHPDVEPSDNEPSEKEFEKPKDVVKPDTECDCQRLNEDNKRLGNQNPTDATEIEKLQRKIHNQGIRIRRMQAALSKLSKTAFLNGGMSLNPSKKVQLVIL